MAHVAASHCPPVVLLGEDRSNRAHAGSPVRADARGIGSPAKLLIEMFPRIREAIALTWARRRVIRTSAGRHRDEVPRPPRFEEREGPLHRARSEEHTSELQS